MASTPAGPRACRPCAASKAKCVFPVELSLSSGKCRRCNRLDKVCTLQTPAPRRTRAERPAAVGVARLEEKMDDLVTLLRSSKNPSFKDLEHGIPTRVDRSIVDVEFAESSIQQPLAASTYYGHSQNPKRTQPTEDRDQLLNLYREDMAPQFPFVAIPDGIDAKTLGQSKPYLLRTILMVSSFKDLPSVDAQATELVEDLSAALVVRAEQNLDLLQSLLLFVAWHHFTVHLARRMSTMLQLAMSLVIDLSLGEDPALIPRFARSQIRLQAGLKVFESMPTSNERTLEDRRAYLGLAYLCSMASVYVAHMDVPRHTRYAELSLQIIEQLAEYPTDRILVQLVRLQKFSDQISNSIPGDSIDLFPDAFNPIAVRIRTLQEKINNFHNNLPYDLQQNPFLLMHYYAMLTYLTETSLFIPIPSRHATLQACLSSVQGFIYTLFTVPLFNHYKLTYMHWVQFLYVISALGKLSNFDSEDWDVSHVRSVIDLSLALDGMIDKLEALHIVTTGGGSKSGQNILIARSVGTLRRYKEDFEKKRNELLARREAMTQTLAELAPPDDMGELMFNQLDDMFWQEIMPDEAFA